MESALKNTLSDKNHLKGQMRVNPSDAVLAEKIGEGCSESFEKIYERYHRPLFFMAKKYLKDQELAEDAVQDIFVKLWEKRDTLDASRSVKGFLFTMLKNHLLNVIRDQKKKIISVYKVDVENLLHSGQTDDDIIYKDYQNLVKRGLNELPDRKREVFELKISGYSNAQIAEILLISIHTVKTQYYHGSKFIRSYLKNHSDT
ncbi:MAG: RNA polymerase sigma-70 factor [Balneolaceae bacterium]